eukprot:40094-Chlamydomonas_euryale.AAC.1
MMGSCPQGSCAHTCTPPHCTETELPSNVGSRERVTPLNVNSADVLVQRQAATARLQRSSGPLGALVSGLGAWFQGWELGADFRAGWSWELRAGLGAYREHGRELGFRAAAPIRAPAHQCTHFIHSQVLISILARFCSHDVDSTFWPGGHLSLIHI